MAMNNEYMRDYMRERWRRRRAEAIAYLGGSCVRCGSTENLQFDHIDPATKSFNISKWSGKNEKDFWIEIKKCQILCEDCHKLKNREDIASGKSKRLVTHGKYWAAYQHKCTCPACLDFKTQYNKQRRERRKMKRKPEICESDFRG